MSIYALSMVVFTYAFLRRYFKPVVVQGTEGAEEKESPLLHARSDPSLDINELTDDDVPEGMPVKFRNSEPVSTKGQPTKHVAQGSSTDAPQQADIVSLDMLSLDQNAAAEIRRQVLGLG